MFRDLSICLQTYVATYKKCNVSRIPVIPTSNLRIATDDVTHMTDLTMTNCRRH